MKKESKLQSTSGQPTTTGLDQGRSRAVIENVKPEIDCGRFPAKRTVGERMTVEADIFVDGHDALSALLLYRKEGASTWIETPMQPLVNDRWRGTFEVNEIGNYYYTSASMGGPLQIMAPRIRQESGGRTRCRSRSAGGRKAH